MSDIEQIVKNYIINNVNGLGLGKILCKNISLAETLYYWYFIKHILLPNQKYKIRYSREFIRQRESFDVKTEQNIKFIENIFRNGSKGGVSLNKLMSNNIKDKNEYFDKMLHMMKIHHLHLDFNFGKKRSSDLLFVTVLGNNVGFIYYGDHSNLCDPKLLEIAYYNWPRIPRMKYYEPLCKYNPTRDEILNNDWTSTVYSMEDGYCIMLSQAAFNVLDNQGNVIKGKGGHLKGNYAYANWALDAIDKIEKFKDLKILGIEHKYNHLLVVNIITSEYTKGDYFNCKYFYGFHPEPSNYKPEVWKKLANSDSIPIKIILG